MSSYTQDFIFVHETENAICVREEDDESNFEIWIPASQIDEIHGEKKAGEVVTVSMSRWIAKRKNLIR